MKKDAYYFPHFSNARSDRKIKRVRKELGLEGYGIYFMLLETLREQQDFKYPIKDIDLLADEYGTSEQKVSAVVYNYDLFSVSDCEFFSPKQIEYLIPYLENRERKRIGGIRGNLLKYNKISKEELSKMSDSDVILFAESVKLVKFSHTDSVSESDSDRSTSQMKGKEMKGKEMKGKESKNIYSLDFEHFWSEWTNNILNQSNKKKSFDSFKKLSDIDKKDLFASIFDYSKSSKDHQYLKRCETYISQRHWEQRLLFVPKVRAMGDF